MDLYRKDLNRDGMHALVNRKGVIQEWIGADEPMPDRCNGWFDGGRSGEQGGDPLTGRASAPAPPQRRTNEHSSSSTKGSSMIDDNDVAEAAGDYLSIVAHPALILTGNRVAQVVVDETAKIANDRMPKAAWTDPVVRVGAPFAAGAGLLYASDSEHVQSVAQGIGIVAVSEGIEWLFEKFGVPSPDSPDKKVAEGSDDMGVARVSDAEEGEDMALTRASDAKDRPAKQLEGHAERGTAVDMGAPGPDARMDRTRTGSL